MVGKVDQDRYAEVDDAVFRNVVGHFASGVTVITAAAGGHLYGSTVSAVSSLSLDPPMMLVCLNRKSSTHGGVLESGRFAVNILAYGQESLAMNFASSKESKYEDVDYSLSPHGIPLLDGALATIECVVEETAVGGTHTVFLARVASADTRPGEPLAYFRGKFGRLERIQENTAYAAVRKAVLTRTTRLGEALDVEATAAGLRVDPQDVHNALIRLSAEGLAVRADDGSFAPTPITIELATSLFDARAAIEVGVIDAHFGRLTDEDVERLSETSALLAAAATGTSVTDGAGLEAFLELTSEFHERIIALAQSPQLTSAYRQMSLTGLWRETLAADEWGAWLDTTHLAELTEALERRDAAAAREALLRHAVLVREQAAKAIERHGGAV
ncbi:flavin reductase [Arthrobacter sp. I2-34]|uniref:Flavin reductase n=1 Tax=Arthrobacter hankyongi TaxID=2904801 RepID=A0ABS9L7Z2_9MICC|nr:flavin reductase [Arthrobacter hankyongi]MCG2622638.1 flavin reductase [Arthrobacter hankyongi]